LAVPDRLAAFGQALGAAIMALGPDWIATLELQGCWPVPDGGATFGKGSSCIVGFDLPISCAEVELTGRARRAGWKGGWVSTFNPDARFPSAWRSALISQWDADQLIAAEFPRAAGAVAGVPDLIFLRDGLLVAAECKRRRGRYRNNQCEWRTGGDTFKQSQERWWADATVAGVPAEALLSIWWDRIDSADCA
jgi:hypothetical protein